MNMSHSLRTYQATAEIFKDYGVAPPKALTDALEKVKHATHLAAAERGANEPAADARAVLAAKDPEKALATAATARSTANARLEVAQALRAVAIEDAAHAAIAVHDELVAGVLASGPLADAFADVVRVAPLVPAGTPEAPDAAQTGFDTVANVAILRRAEGVIRRALTRLTAVGALPLDDDQGAALMSLVLVQVDYTRARPTAVDRGLRGVRPGALDMPVFHTSVQVATSMHAPGVPSAILSEIPGVTLALAASADELEARIASHLDARSGHSRRGGVGIGAGPAVVLDD